MPTKRVVINGIMKTIQIDDAGNQVAGPIATPGSTLADPNKALTFSTNFDQANEDALAAGTRLAPSTITALDTIQNPTYLTKFGNPEVANEAIYNLSNEIFTKLQAPIGLLNKLLILQNFNIHVKIDDSASMRGARWLQARTRLLEMMDVLQIIPTGPITLSFLDRRDTITIVRYGKTPAQFYREVSNWINREFQSIPNGNTPIYRNVDSMLRNARGQTAHYLITDGVPNDYGMDPESTEREVNEVKDRILRRNNPIGNPVTLMCCSTDPQDTQWMHEVEEIACMPGRQPGYVAALQNFDAERLEVLNDQGAWLPYSRSVWLICTLIAALNPYDLDALDQHAPLSKPIIDSFLGRVATMTEYEGYFLQHPNATWLFKEDYKLFVLTQITNQIPSVAYFENTLGNKLDYAISRGYDNTEFSDLKSTEQMLLTQFSRQRPQVIFDQRGIFWDHYGEMERQQLQALRNQSIVSQHLWADFVGLASMGGIVQAYVQSCHPYIVDVIQELAESQQKQQQMQIDHHPTAEGEEPPPPPYSGPAMTLSDPQYDEYNKPRYYNGYVQPVAVYNQSSNNQTMWQPSQSPQMPYQPAGGYNQDYNNRRYQSSCCTMF